MAGQFLDVFVKLQKATVSLVMYVCLSVCLPVCPSIRRCWWNNTVPTGRFFMKFDIWVFFENLSKSLIFIKIWHE